ncbi:hypothetical protein QQF64_001644 [Cirrhinus molitorella]|uniref:Uncharacterized protein n=1 Tax=Cirrhinus molitorella TaxID=172907 RepID=A0ABR3P196_9TELE
MTDNVSHNTNIISEGGANRCPYFPKHRRRRTGLASKSRKQKPISKPNKKSRRHDRCIIALLHSSSTDKSPFGPICRRKASAPNQLRQG